jgi:hypothetical protein
MNAPKDYGLCINWPPSLRNDLQICPLSRWEKITHTHTHTHTQCTLACISVCVCKHTYTQRKGKLHIYKWTIWHKVKVVSLRHVFTGHPWGPLLKCFHTIAYGAPKICNEKSQWKVVIGQEILPEMFQRPFFVVEGRSIESQTHNCKLEIMDCMASLSLQSILQR